MKDLESYMQLHKHIEELGNLITKGIINIDDIRELMKSKKLDMQSLLYLKSTIHDIIDKIEVYKTIHTTEKELEYANAKEFRLKKADEDICELIMDLNFSVEHTDVLCHEYCKRLPKMLKIFNGDIKELAIFITYLQKECDFGKKEISNKDIATLMSILAYDEIIKGTCFGIYNSLLELTDKNPPQMVTGYLPHVEVEELDETTGEWISLDKGQTPPKYDEYEYDANESIKPLINSVKIKISTSYKGFSKQFLKTYYLKAVFENNSTQSANDTDETKTEASTTDKTKEIIRGVKEKYAKHREMVAQSFK